MVFCGKCGKEIFVYTEMKLGGIKTKMCRACVKSLKDYFEMRDDTYGKDIRLCLCCKRYKEVGYEDSYEKGKIVFCKGCAKLGELV